VSSGEKEFRDEDELEEWPALGFARMSCLAMCFVKTSWYVLYQFKLQSR
jgi:hypothetical protein